MLRKVVCIISLWALIAEGALSPPKRSYKILMLLPFSPTSHRIVFMPLANALADRGHEVTMMSNKPLDHPKINHYLDGINRTEIDDINMFEIGRDYIKLYMYVKNILPQLFNIMYDDPIVKELYARRKEFDLIVIDYMLNNIMYPFVHELNFITIATAGLDPAHSAAMGNFINPAYAPSLLADYNEPYSFSDKIKNIFYTIMSVRLMRDAINAPAQAEVSRRFPHLPPLLEIEANQSLSLLNHHFILGKAVPLLPNQVNVGGMHCRPAKPLPKDLEKFLSGNTPVIYMSLGSVSKSNSIPQKYQEIIKTTFSILPYKVLWKYEDNLKEVPKNIMIKEWMPQQDILAHPNVKVFITHCGLQSTQEAMYHSTPMVGLPVFADQPRVGKAMENAGLGRVLIWEELSVDKLTEAVIDVFTNPEYHKNILQISAAFRDQLEDSPTERAVFWTEYAIKHNGNPHFKSPGKHLNWIQLLHLDIILAIQLTFYLVYRFVIYIIGMYLKISKPQKGLKSKFD